MAIRACGAAIMAVTGMAFSSSTAHGSAVASAAAGRGSMAAVEGEVRLVLECSGEEVTWATVASERPEVGRLLRGRPLGEALEVIPRLYSVCGRAQGVAAEALVQAAQGVTPEPSTVESWRHRVRLETLREHVLRLCVDWPALAGLPADPEPLAFVLGTGALAEIAPGTSRAREQAQALADALFGEPAADWLELESAAGIAAWARYGRVPLARVTARLWPELQGLGKSAVPLLPWPTRQDSLESLLPRMRTDRDFARAPDWGGHPRETGPLAREQAHPPVAELLERHGATALPRLVARISETARLVLEAMAPARATPLRLHSCPLPDGALVCLEMVRGLLVHWAMVGADDRIGEYRIVAPTEWNFHPAGACLAGLWDLAAADRPSLERAVARHVAALDPCVRYTVEVREAPLSGWP